MLIPVLRWPTSSHIFLTPTVMLGQNHKNPSRCTFWATIETWWANMAASLQMDALWPNRNTLVTLYNCIHACLCSIPVCADRAPKTLHIGPLNAGIFCKSESLNTLSLAWCLGWYHVKFNNTCKRKNRQNRKLPQQQQWMSRFGPFSPT